MAAEAEHLRPPLWFTDGHIYVAEAPAFARAEFAADGLLIDVRVRPRRADREGLQELAEMRSAK